MKLDEYQIKIADFLSKLSDEDFIASMRYLCRTDLFFLLHYACGRKDMAHPWLFDRCREVQKSPNGHLDLWSRGHYKSSIITFGKTIQDVLASHGEDPLPEWRGREITVGIFSHNRPMAKDFLRQIKRELEDNMKLKCWFPDILYENPQSESPKWNEDAGLIVKRKSNPKEATIEAAGVVEGQPTGKHYAIRIYDDLVHDKYVTSPEMIRKTTEAWDMSQNLKDNVFGIVRYIGTIYHKSDTYAEMMKRGVVKPRIHPATTDGTATGEPVLLSKEALNEIRKGSTPYIFSCQMLLNPLADEQTAFQRSWLKYYDYKPGIESSMNVYITVDPASAKKKNSDYTVFWVIGLSNDNNYYHLDLIRDRMNLKERTDMLFYLHRRWKPIAVGYEKYSMQCDIEHIEGEMKRENYRFNIIELGGIIKKEDRIRKMSPIDAAGRFYIQETQLYRDYTDKLVDLVKIFVEDEFTSFPVSAHDDMLDARARVLDQELGARFPLLDGIKMPKTQNKDRWREISHKRLSSRKQGWAY